jgi:cytochrome c-type biogenesis protein CcmH/NrfG
MLSKLSTVLVFATTVIASSVPALPQPTKQPAPRNPAHRRLVEEGVQLNDLGDYNAAVRRFEQVLEDNPNDVGALYELGNTLMAAKE